MTASAFSWSLSEGTGEKFGEQIEVRDHAPVYRTDFGFPEDWTTELGRVIEVCETLLTQYG